MAIRFFDMFSGIGGFRSGLESIGGFECAGHCEIDKQANQAYCAMYDVKQEEVYFNDTQKSIQKTYQISTLYVQVFLAKVFQLLEDEEDSTTSEVRYSLKLPVSLPI